MSKKNIRILFLLAIIITSVSLAVIMAGKTTDPADSPIPLAGTSVPEQELAD